MNADEQIKGVAGLIHHATIVSPKGLEIRLNIDDLRVYADHDVILEKMSLEYKLIKIIKKPSVSDTEYAIQAGLGDDDFLDFRASYLLAINESFEHYYENLVGREAVVLTPESYNKQTGILLLTATKPVSIAEKGKTRKPDGTKYFNCHVMDLLFKNTDSLKGVYFYEIIGKKDYLKLSDKEIKKVRNFRTTINNKSKEVNGPSKLILLDKTKAYINHLYL